MSEKSVNQQAAADQHRPYQSERRAQQASATRQRILEAAEPLFLERGYAGTTTKAIAAAAGVVEKTVFLTFPGKAALLSELIRIRVRGEEPDVRAVESEAWRSAALAQTDDLLPRFAELIAEIHGRTARLVAIAEAAVLSDAELAARRDLGHASIRATAGTIVDELAARRLLDAAWSPEQAKDILFALTHEGTFLRLTAECGWTTDEYVTWLARTASATLLRS